MDAQGYLQIIFFYGAVIGGACFLAMILGGLLSGEELRRNPPK